MLAIIKDYILEPKVALTCNFVSHKGFQKRRQGSLFLITISFVLLCDFIKFLEWMVYKLYIILKQHLYRVNTLAWAAIMITVGIVPRALFL